MHPNIDRIWPAPNSTWASISEINGKPADAATCYDDAISALSEAGRQVPRHDPDYRHLEANALTNRANLLRATNHPTEAREGLAQAGELPTATDGRTAGRARLPQRTAWSQRNSASCWRRGDRRPEAEKAWGQALDLPGETRRRLPRNPVYREGLAKYHGNLGVLYAQDGRLVQAEKSYRKNVALIEELAAANPDALVYQQDLIGPYTNLIQLLTLVGAPSRGVGGVSAAAGGM